MTGAPKSAVLIGLGMVADMHAAAIAATGGAVRLAAVHSRRPERARAFAERHGSPSVLSSLDEVVKADGIDFAILATPPDARTEFVDALSARGVPILTEKPLGRDLDEARELVRICADRSVPFGAVLQHRMRPAVLALGERLRAGELGDIASVELRVPWWRDQGYYDVPGRGSYARDGGGVLMTQAIHSLDLMLQFCGPAAMVQAMTRTTSLHRLEAEDFAAAAVSFASGTIGSVMASVTHYPGAPEEIVLNGRRGSAHLTANRLRIHLHDREPVEIGAVTGSGGGADPMAFSHEWHRAVIEDFALSLDQRREPAITAASALGVHALIEAIMRSARTGRCEEVANV